MSADPAALPKITVVTPSFNQGQYIEHTLRSVLEQGYPKLEYFVLDGGSTDGTLAVLEAYRERLAYTSEPDRGQTHAVNKGLARASGEIVCFLNSDDLLAPGALHQVGGFFAAHPECSWLSGRCRIIDEQGAEIMRPVTWYKNAWLATRSARVLQVLNYLSQPATFWRRQLLESTGLLNEDLHYVMDYEYWLRLLQSEKLHVTRAVLALFRVHTASKGATGTQAQFAEELAVARKYVQSPCLLKLHHAHNALILWAYRHMEGRMALNHPQPPPSPKLGEGGGSGGG